MLAVLLIYACLQAERSSRKIEARCRTDAAFRVATGNAVPDHSTICRFRSRAAGPGGTLEDLFTQVLFVLATAGLGRLGVISVDGSKIWADASKQANRTEAGLRKLARTILDEAARADGEGCACAGHEPRRGRRGAGPGFLRLLRRRDAARAGPGRPGRAARRLGRRHPGAAEIAAGLAELEAARLDREAERRAAAETRLAAVRAGTAPPGAVPAEIAVEVAQLRLEQALAADAATDARWAAARPATAFPAAAAKAPRAPGPARPAPSSPPPSRPARTRTRPAPRRR
jgi:hypothetical protein